MKFLPILLLLTIFINNCAGDHGNYDKTLYGPSDARKSHERLTINRNFDDSTHHDHQIIKRSPYLEDNNDTIIRKINHLHDRHRQFVVHWTGDDNEIVIFLGRDLPPQKTSSVFLSYDHGDTYINKTDSFKLPNGDNALLETFYNHPRNKSHLVFTDVKNKFLFVTKNNAIDVERIKLDFTPSDLLYFDLDPSKFLILDKNDPKRILYITENYGKTFRYLQDAVKAYKWIKTNDDTLPYVLLIEYKPLNGSSTISYSSTLFSSTIYATNIKDFYIKNDYIFTTNITETGAIELYVSYKFNEKFQCVFDTNLQLRSFYIVDITNDRAMIAVSHTDTVSHLYVSENLNKNNGPIHFTLSLQDVLCYFPDTAWSHTWIGRGSDEAFADVYKVKGLSGIYIASRVLKKRSDNNNVKQYDFGSVITYDHGRSWHLLDAPPIDLDGQRTSCSTANNCSLHLIQKANELYRHADALNILSSELAPGIIIANGVPGKTFDGVYSVYISTDAGITWRHTLNGIHFYQMGDKGGILIAAKYSNFTNTTKSILYSTDYGDTWMETEFYDNDIRLNFVSNGANEKTTVFTLFGSLQQQLEWIIFKIDFSEIFNSNCTIKAYTPWVPNQGDGDRGYLPCLLGQQLAYHRRRRSSHAKCFNGLDYELPISVRPCDCHVYDYECDFGFISDKSGNCILNKLSNYDPYKIPDDCKPDHFYNRTKGYRKIQGDQCINGTDRLYNHELLPCPIDDIEEFLLIGQTDRILYYNLITKQFKSLPIGFIQNIVTIDFDMKNNCVYWTDNNPKVIKRQCFNDKNLNVTNNGPEILVSKDLGLIEGMALDWTSNTLYFVDSIKAKIQVIRTDINHSGRMRRTILGPDVLKKPRAIALHPKLGYIFWTDWSIDNPSVNRANLNGDNLMKLFGKPRVEWPNGIAIDYMAERIYWVDGRQHYIASSDLYGGYFKILIQNVRNVEHPFAIAVFKNSIYWNDWKTKALYSSDKNNYNSSQIITRQLIFEDMKVYGNGLQTATNTCTNTKCPYICVGSPKIGHSDCLCPDGFDYFNGECFCPGNLKPNENFTCPEFNNTCSPEHFTCNNRVCIPKIWQCDNEDDCGDNSDEFNCSHTKCLHVQFTCKNGHCISDRLRCDGINHCGDNSDESDCEKPTCSSDYFTCDNGKCIPKRWQCDYSNDCGDNSDESNCGSSTCTSQEFTCINGKCVSQLMRCNHKDDCGDNSDEKDCEKPTRSSDYFTCDNGKYIAKHWQCDKDDDCGDNSDERDCEKQTCSSDYFTCNNGKCIPKRWHCDYSNDCGDYSDEMNCERRTCTPQEFTCINGKCISQLLRCNHKDDCGDNSDERDCEKQTCLSAYFTCDNSKCIPQHWQCDKEDDCGDNSDERDCGKPTRSTDNFTCDNGKSIPKRWQCDKEDDCGDYSDEMNCERRTCTPQEFTCINGKCISQLLHCNHQDDCGDNSDEKDCNRISCSLNEFTCTNGKCISRSFRCDYDNDCGDNSDELNCQPPSCSIQEFTCNNGKCIPKRWYCDQTDDCGDKSDELKCTGNCSHDHFICNNGKCIPERWHCDYTDDCGDDSDEKDCKRVPCTSDQFICPNGKCIPQSWRCNDKNDCGDYSDELNCQNSRCSSDHFLCANGKCISHQLHCNHKDDCGDNSDELKCTTQKDVLHSDGST